MAMPKLTINVQNGGLNRSGLNEDIISGLVFYNSGYSGIVGTTGSTYSGVTLQVGSIEEAEGFSITEAAFPVEFFQIKNYFNGNPNGILYVGVFKPTVGTGYTFEEINTLAIFAEGKIRRFGIQMPDVALSTTHVNLLQGIADGLYNDEMPASIYYAPNTYATAYTALPDLRVLSAKYVSVLIGQSASGTAATLAASKGYSITPLGLLLGLKSLAIEENCGWRAEYNFVSGDENDSLRIGTTAYKEIPSSALNTLNDKGYIFLCKEKGMVGTFINDMPTASVLAGNDFAFQTEVEVMFKAIRGVRAALKPYILSKQKVQKDGKLDWLAVQVLENAASLPLIEMQKVDEISEYRVSINPDQNVVSTSKITVIIGVLPVGYAREIVVNIGFKAKL